MKHKNFKPLIAKKLYRLNEAKSALTLLGQDLKELDFRE